jgi:hypothetical protein
MDPFVHDLAHAAVFEGCGLAREADEVVVFLEVAKDA